MDDIDNEDELEALLEKVSSLYGTTKNRTTLSLAEEAHRKAKQSNNLIQLLNANFYIMNSANAIFEFERSVQACLENIPLLESDEEAARFQPDYDPNQYYQYRWWLSACTYDNLATATANLNGYNADGLHQCIADGIAVCQRTGKTECVACFREYATDVFIAADDLAMAKKHAELNARPRPGTESKHEWIGTRDLLRIATLNGDLDEAEALLESIGPKIKGYYNVEKATGDTYAKKEELAILTGKIDSFEALNASREQNNAYTRSEEEHPWGTMSKELNEALLHAAMGNYESAQTLLARWDRWLLSKHATDDWFEVRLRLLAIAKYQNEDKKFDRLAKQLLEKANNANDWLTKRRFQYLKTQEVALTPLVLVGSPSKGIFATAESAHNHPVAGAESNTGNQDTGNQDTGNQDTGNQDTGNQDTGNQDTGNQDTGNQDTGNQDSAQAAASSEQDATESSIEASQSTDSSSDDAATSQSDLQRDLQQAFLSIVQNEDDEARQASIDALWQRMTSHSADGSSSDDAMMLLSMAERICWQIEHCWTAWPWARALCNAHPDELKIQSLGAALGESFLQAHQMAEYRATEAEDSPAEASATDSSPNVDDSETSGAASNESPEIASAESKSASVPDIPDGLTQAWVRETHESVVKGSEDEWANFARAGAYYYRQNELDAAERNLARASRLNRQDSFAALKLAEIYKNSDRQLDALNVLDLCIREGTEDPDVYWDAIMCSRAADRHEELITYAEQFDKLVDDYPWSAYYAADSMLTLGRHADALAKIERLKSLNEDAQLAIYTMTALASAGVGNQRQAEEAALSAIELPLRECQQISTQGMAVAVERLFTAGRLLHDDDAGLRQWHDRLVARFGAPGLLPESYFNDLRGQLDASDVRFLIVKAEIDLPSDWNDSKNALLDQVDWTRAEQRFGVLATDEAEASLYVTEYLQVAWPETASSRESTPCRFRVIEVDDENESIYEESPGIVWCSLLVSEFE